MATAVKDAVMRATVSHDMYAECPYDEGQSPILFTDYRTAAQEDRIGNYVVHAGLVAAWERWGVWSDAFERYARIFHGCTRVAYLTTRDGAYATFDPAEWRDLMGATPAADWPIDDVAMFGEFGGWLEGDTWQVIIEEQCSMGEWHAVDFSHTFYSEADAQAEAESYMADKQVPA